MPSPGIIEYPTALDTPLSLIEVANNGSSTLTANISVGDLLIPVAQPGKFTNSGIATLTDSLTAPTKIEIFLYTSKSGNNLVVPVGGRGAQGTTAQAFSTGNFVEQRPTARHHTALADVIMAIQAKLGIGADTPGGVAEALMSNGAGASLWRAIFQSDITGLAAALGDKISKSDAALQTLIGDLLLSNSVPTVKLTDATSGKTFIFLVNSSGICVLGEEGISNALQIAPGTGEVTFEEVPLGPAANPPTANHLTRRDYVDSTSVAFSANWFESDPSITTVSNEDRAWAFVPDGNTITVNKWRVNYLGGSHTSGGSVTFTLRVRNAAGAPTDLASVTLDNTNSAVNTNYTTSFGPNTLTPGDRLSYYISARSPTVSERSVSLGVLGTQKRI